MSERPTRNGGKVYQSAAEMFRLLSHPARLRIVDELRNGNACVCHLQAVLRRPQPYVSQQLRVLRDAGVVGTWKDNTYVYYCLSDSRLEQVLQSALGSGAAPIDSEICVCPVCEAKT